MALSKNQIEKIKEKYKDAFDSLAHYDETREKLWGRKRIDITLDVKIIKKLKKLSEKTGKPVSRIIEGAIAKI